MPVLARSTRRRGPLGPERGRNLLKSKGNRLVAAQGTVLAMGPRVRAGGLPVAKYTEKNDMKRVVMALFLTLAVACGDTGGTAGGDNGGNTGGGNTGGGSGGEQQQSALCSATNKCPSGMFCFNGLCAIGCTSNNDCAADQYCDTKTVGPIAYCQNKVVKTCAANGDCAASQLCLNGLCSMKPPEVKPACQLTYDANDGCGEYSLCHDPVEDNDTEQDAYCASFSPCPESGVCPVGEVGSVCNEGYLSGKGRFCLSGACRTDANCPTSWSCVGPMFGAPLGFCSMGTQGMPCMENKDCRSNTCMQPMPGMLGACQ